MASQLAVEAPPQSEPEQRRDFGSSARLAGGFLGRAWLWFLAGCLVVTFVPMLFGWRPYVVESGSMQPRIKVGDVILASPEHDAKKLLGHVTVFTDPDAAHPGTVKSHRVIKINPDGTLQTKGDANPTPDSVPVPMSDVRGIGRLLVRWIGLPLIWVQRGEWLWFGLLLLSVFGAAVLVARDHEEPVAEDDDDSGGDDFDGDGPDAPEPFDYAGREGAAHERDASYRPVSSGTLPQGAEAPPTGSVTTDFAALASATVTPGRHFRNAIGRHRRRSRAGSTAHWLASRVAVAGLGVVSLLVPTVQAAFVNTTVASANTWTAASSFGPSYTDDVENLTPYLYWKLDDGAGTAGSPNTTAIDYSGNSRNGQYSPTPYGSASWAMQQPGALQDGWTPNYSVTAAGGRSATTTCVYTKPGVAAENPAPTTYSEIVWFKTTSTQGGKLIGFESAQTGVSDSSSGGQYDRQVYMDGNGRLWFGVWTGTTTTVSSTASYNDGSWHMAVATMGTDGMQLYVDGSLVGSNANTTSQDYTALGGGWWRTGCGNLSGWGGAWSGPNAPGTTQTNYGFAGSIDEATVYTTELTGTNVATLWAAAHGTTYTPPAGLVNGDFETGALTPWTCDGGGSIQTGTTHGGTYALRAAGYRQNEQCQQAVTLLPNHAYTLRAYVEGRDITVGVSGGATASSSVNNANNWTQLTVNFTTDATGSVTVYVDNNAAPWWQANTFYADDFTVS